MKHYIAGQLAHAREITAFLAPYVNSYKRFCVGMFAPTKAVWSTDNRTAGFRVCGEGTKAIRVECRIRRRRPEPLSRLAALLAAGLDGIEQKMDLEPEMKGDMYRPASVREIPKTLREAADLLNGSYMLRAAFGDDVIDHYHHAAQWEISGDGPRRHRFRDAAGFWNGPDRYGDPRADAPEARAGALFPMQDEDMMTKMIQLISPVDGQVYAERPALTLDAARGRRRAGAAPRSPHGPRARWTSVSRWSRRVSPS